MGSPQHIIAWAKGWQISMFANATVYMLKPYDIISTKFGMMTDQGRDFFRGGEAKALTHHSRTAMSQITAGLRFSSSTCTEVSGVENIGQCCRLSQLCWLLGAL